MYRLLKKKIFDYSQLYSINLCCFKIFLFKKIEDYDFIFYNFILKVCYQRNLYT